MPKRCAFGCKNTGTGVTMHTLPNPNKFIDRFQAWVSALGGKLETPSDYEYYKKKRVCDIHFSYEHRNRYRRLNILAVPSLNLSATMVHSTANNTSSVMMDHSYIKTMVSSTESFSKGTLIFLFIYLSKLTTTFTENIPIR